MTIPPVGSNSNVPSQPDDRVNNGAKPQRQEKAEQHATESPKKADHVEISAETRVIRERQADITRLQVSERALKDIRKESRELKNDVDRIRDTISSGNRESVESAKRLIKERIARIEQKDQWARYGNEELLDGRRMSFTLPQGVNSIYMPDAEKMVFQLTREAQDAVDENRAADNDKVDKQIEKTCAAMSDVRACLEHEIRDAIAGVVRQSSGNQPSDAADAERLIMQARESIADQTGTKPGASDITGKAVDLLK
ncbi:MAG: hypothetical protein ABIC40_04620 [bacterium]